MFLLHCHWRLVRVPEMFQVVEDHDRAQCPSFPLLIPSVYLSLIRAHKHAFSCNIKVLTGLWHLVLPRRDWYRGLHIMCLAHHVSSLVYQRSGGVCFNHFALPCSMLQGHAMVWLHIFESVSRRQGGSSTVRVVTGTVFGLVFLWAAAETLRYDLQILATMDYSENVENDGESCCDKEQNDSFLDLGSGVCG